MRKTIEQILLDSLKDKHATVYYGNSNVYNFSGFVRDVKVQTNWDYTSVILSVDTGKEKLEIYEVDLLDETFEIC